MCVCVRGDEAYPRDALDHYLFADLLYPHAGGENCAHPPSSARKWSHGPLHRMVGMAPRARANFKSGPCVRDSGSDMCTISTATRERNQIEQSMIREKLKGNNYRAKSCQDFSQFSHFFRIFPPGLSRSKQRVLAQSEQKRRKDSKKNRTNRCCTLVVARLSSSWMSSRSGRWSPHTLTGLNDTGWVPWHSTIGASKKTSILTCKFWQRLSDYVCHGRAISLCPTTAWSPSLPWFSISHFSCIPGARTQAANFQRKNDVENGQRRRLDGRNRAIQIENR